MAPPTPERLIDRQPFDLVILNQASGGEQLEVSPLDLPQRPLSVLPTEGKLTVRLLQRPLEQFELSWSSVAQIRVYEQLLLEEAQRLTAAGNFDEAYDYFARLLADYPSLAGLRNAVSDYLRRNALALYQAKQHDRALAVLVALFQQDSNYAGLASAVETVAGEIIEGYLREGKYAAARSVLDLWKTQLPGLATPAADRWQQRFEAAAARQLDEATRLVQQKQYVAARKAVARAIGIWPQLEAANTLRNQIQREFPFIMVGVLEAAPRQPSRRIDNWAALRTSRLVERLLAEQIDFGSEGGVYRSPYGEWVLDDSGRMLSLKLASVGGAAPTKAALTPDRLARFLLMVAEPGAAGHRSDLGRLLSGVSIAPDNNSVRLHLSQVHVRPEGMLQIPAPAAAKAAPYAVDDYGENEVMFAAAADRAPAGLRAVVEQHFSDDGQAVSALLAGDVEVLDRVPPWHIERLRAAQGIRVGTYRLPTVHVLIPNLDRPLPAKREFRRALCFGIDRKWIVERVLLGGTTLAGFEVVSGPFPAGMSHSDPVRYGYNNQVAPRPFEPRLAAILATIAWSTAQKSTGDEEAVSTDIPEVVLAHPSEPAARIACQMIQAQLARQGIPIKLHEFSADDLAAGRVECDLRYAELAVWEPLTDARLVMGPGGLAGDLRSAYLGAALRKLGEATNWKDVRSSLAELHEIAHHELPVIPLWQTVNFYAYRTSLRGIGESPVTLYQDVDQWSTAAGASVAGLQPAPAQ